MRFVIVEGGRPRRVRMNKERSDASDTAVAAGDLQGLKRMDQITSAILKRTCGISVIPRPKGVGEPGIEEHATPRRCALLA